MKFILFSYNLTGASIAYKMQEEGHDVLVGQIPNKEDTLLDEELKHYKPEKKESKEKRMSLFDGMLKKINAWKLLKFLQGQKPSKDWYIFVDSNDSWRFGEELYKLGFQGHFPLEQDRILEVNREKAKEFVRKNYPDIKVAEYHAFKKIKEGISFLKKSDIVYVLKSLGDAGNTIVPMGDIAVAKDQIINQLKTSRKDYEQNGFILEEKIEEPKELTPEIVFYDGELLHMSLDIENKSLGSGNIGPSMGCGQNLIIKTNKDAAINKIAFPKFIFDLAKQRRGYFIWDISLLFDKNNKPYFGEFCPNRLGWDSFPTITAMSGDPDGKKIVTPYFQKILKKENPLIYNFGSGVRLFNIAENKILSDIKITWDKEAEPDIYLYDPKKVKNEILTVGQAWDLAVVTGIGKTPKESIERCYEYVKMFHVADSYYRPKEDFLSTEYRTSILNRYDYYLKNLK